MASIASLFIATQNAINALLRHVFGKFNTCRSTLGDINFIDVCLSLRYTCIRDTNSNECVLHCRDRQFGSTSNVCFVIVIVTNIPGVCVFFT